MTDIASYEDDYIINHDAYKQWTKNLSLDSILLMLTQNDLKQIAKLFDERFTDQFDKRLTPINDHFTGIEKTLEEHTKLLNEHTELLNQHTKILNSHSKKFKSLKSDQDVIVKLLDREQMFQRRRLTRVETHLNLPPLTQ